MKFPLNDLCQCSYWACAQTRFRILLDRTVIHLTYYTGVRAVLSRVYCSMVSPPGHGLSAASIPLHATAASSSEAKLRLLERRLTGSLPSPRSISFETNQLAAVSHAEQSISYHINQEPLSRAQQPAQEAGILPKLPESAEGEDSRDTFGIFPAGRESKKRKLDAAADPSGLPPLAARPNCDAGIASTPRAAVHAPSAAQSRRSPSPSLHHSSHTSPPQAQGGAAQKHSSSVFRTPPGTAKKGTCRNTLHQYFPVLGVEGNNRGDGAASSALKDSAQHARTGEAAGPADVEAVRSMDPQTTRLNMAQEGSVAAELQEKVERLHAENK